MAAESAHAEIEKRIRAINKKLKQIQGLKDKEADQLDDAAREKIASEASLQKELQMLEAQLKNGATHHIAAPPPVAAEPVAAAAPVAAAPEVAEEDEEKAEETSNQEPNEAEKAKRIKAINKKLRDIERLREKGIEHLDAEARAKVEHEDSLREELARLEGRPQDKKTTKASTAPQTSAKTAVSNGVHSAPAASVSNGHKKETQGELRARALAPPPADPLIYCDEDTDKRYKALLKKLRDITKLKEKDPGQLDKLQKEKLGAEDNVISEILEIHKKASDALLLLQQKRNNKAA